MVAKGDEPGRGLQHHGAATCAGQLCAHYFVCAVTPSLQYAPTMWGPLRGVAHLFRVLAFAWGRVVKRDGFESGLQHQEAATRAGQL